jgi:hypothetical protein
MKPIIFLLILSDSLFAQTYGHPDINKGPDDGVAKNYSWLAPNGIPVVPYVRSEIEIDGQTYSYIRTGLYDFKLSRKDGEQFIDVIPKLATMYASNGMTEHSRILHIYEDKNIINIYSWGVNGYHFLFYQKRETQEPRLIRLGYIRNSVHGMELFDDSIKSLEFTGAAQLKITKDSPTEAQKRLRPYLFQSPGIYEFRPDGVYLDGVFDPSVRDHEPQDIVDENLQKDPQHYLKKQALHAARVASWNKEQMDAQALITAAQPPQPTRKPTPPQSIPEVNPTPTATAPVIAQESPPSAEPVFTKNLTPWLAGLVAVLVMLLGYLGWRYSRTRARS